MESIYSFYEILNSVLYLNLHLLVNSSLGYKNAVKSVYERKLVQARTKAQQDPQYLLRRKLPVCDRATRSWLENL